MPLGEGGPPEWGGERWTNAGMSCRPSVKAFARWRHATISLCDGDGVWYLYINLAWTPQF